MPAVDAPPPPEGAKFSRYRSVRRAQEQQQIQQQAPPMPAMPSPESQNDSISRSMSRYHRRPRTASSAAQRYPLQPCAEQPPPLPSSSSASHATSASPSAPVRASPSSQKQHSLTNANGSQSRGLHSSRTPTDAAQVLSKADNGPSRTALDEAKRLMQEEALRQKNLQAKLKLEQSARLEAQQVEQERLQKEAREAEEAERKKVQREAEEAERLKQEQERAERGRRLQKAESAARLKRQEEEERKAKHERAGRGAGGDEAGGKPASSPPVSPPRGGFGFLRRWKADEAPSPPENISQSGRPRNTSNTTKDEDTIRPGGGGAVLGIDAPISAVNAGDRRVRIECNKAQINLPVTPITTPLDLIRSASTCLSEPINVKTSVLLESFAKVGLQRPLRNYEHVRDVMNSWDDDKQNALIIVDAVVNAIDQQDLVASQVPESKPTGMSCYVYYSQRPGKWSKRYLTLRPDGQIVVSKNEGSKDSTNVCHLSDFDIYSPTQRKLAKSVRPPKKHCYAVKSQQKSSMFMDESNFVHFFCTNDKGTASLLYSSIQGWRSWYLKHVMGEGQKKPKQTTATPGSGEAELLKRSGFGTAQHSRHASVESHYQLGTFSQLLDLDQLLNGTKPEDGGNRTSFHEEGRPDTKAMHMRKMSARHKPHPPVSYSLNTIGKDGASQGSNRLNSLTKSTSSQSGTEGDAFAPTGLLGRTYSDRQRAMQEREKEPSGPFTEGPSLLSKIPSASHQESSSLGRKASVRSSHHRSSSDIQRSMSTRAKPKPLVDLTPQYREPPQHRGKGKAFVPDSSDAGPLVSNATSPEEAIRVPPSTEWRSRPSRGGPSEAMRALRGGRNPPPEGLAAYAANNHDGAPDDDSKAFTGGGLVSQAGFSQGSVAIGRGVMDGSKARGPMLDIHEGSRFVPGSLLSGVERNTG